MALNTTELSGLIERQLEGLKLDIDVYEEGRVLSVSDGIARCEGLENVMLGELVQFETGSFGLSLNLEKDTVSVVMIDASVIREGSKVKRTKKILEVPVGRELLGRVVNALGQPLDGKGAIMCQEFSPVERIAPGVIWRKSVSQPLQTGLKSIDSMIPIGRGQRELIIGDRQTGKTAIAVDTIINQKGQNCFCVYVAIGQKQSTVSNIVRKLQETGALEYTIIVAATAAESAALQFIAPYAGCAMGEYFRDRGMDALIIYDDLSKHAVAYRQMSLLLRRPPGREAYPGDVFYLHSRLLERAARVSAEYVEKFTEGKVTGKTGSLTALPIIETQGGDVSAFVPTNVISITDGQIYLQSAIFAAGIRPAINPGLSVSRVGGAAQTNIIRKLGGNVRLSLAQYREMEAFAQFAADLDETTRKQLEHGKRVTEITKQPQYTPLTVAQIALSLFAVNEGYLQKIDDKKIVAFEAGLQAYAVNKHQDVLDQITMKPELNDENKKALTMIVQEYVKLFVA